MTQTTFRIWRGDKSGGEFKDYRTDVTRCTVLAKTHMPYQVDGDHLGEVERLEFRHVPDAVKLVWVDRGPRG